MLEQVTLGSALALIVAIPVILQRFKKWQDWDQPNLKPLIITVLGLVAPLVLAGLQAEPHVAANANKTLQDLFMGVWMAAGMFLVHKLDKLLIAFVAWVESKYA